MHSHTITLLIHDISVLRVDSPVSDVSYCLCPTKRLPRREEGWEAYVERKDILVWRREHISKRGLYEYKLYGKFDDVTVWEFLAVQLDLSQFRHSWDTSTAQCREVETQKWDLVEDETDNCVQKPGDDNSQGDAGNGNGNGQLSSQIPQNKSQAIVYYWEVKYPAFFSNRCRLSNKFRVNFTFSLLNVSYFLVFTFCYDKTGMILNVSIFTNNRLALPYRRVEPVSNHI